MSRALPVTERPIPMLKHLNGNLPCILQGVGQVFLHGRNGWDSLQNAEDFVFRRTAAIYRVLDGQDVEAKLGGHGVALVHEASLPLTLPVARLQLCTSVKHAGHADSTTHGFQGRHRALCVPEGLEGRLEPLHCFIKRLECQVALCTWHGEDLKDGHNDHGNDATPDANPETQCTSSISDLVNWRTLRHKNKRRKGSNEQSNEGERRPTVANVYARPPHQEAREWEDNVSHTGQARVAVEDRPDDATDNDSKQGVECRHHVWPNASVQEEDGRDRACPTVVVHDHA